MRHYGSKYFARRHSLTLGMGSKGHNSADSAYGHVAYQFKGNHKMQQQGNKYFACRPLPPSSDHGDGVTMLKFNLFFQKMAMFNLQGITNAATC